MRQLSRYVVALQRSYIYIERALKRNNVPKGECWEKTLI